LFECLDECSSLRQVVILDCCFSGAFGLAKGDTQDVRLEELFGESAEESRGRAVLTASRATENSFEGASPTGGASTGSVFTSVLLDGLRTGKADKNQDGFVSVKEAYEYAYAEVRKQGGKQTPQHWLYGGEGADVVLTRSPVGRKIEPAVLPDQLREVLESRYPKLRRGAVEELAAWLDDADPGRVVAAYEVIEHVAAQDIPEVALAARDYLRAYEARSQAGVLRPTGRPRRGPSTAPSREGKQATADSQRRRTIQAQSDDPQGSPGLRKNRGATPTSARRESLNSRSSHTVPDNSGNAATGRDVPDQVAPRSASTRGVTVPTDAADTARIDDIVRALTRAPDDTWHFTHQDYQKAMRQLSKMRVGGAAEVLSRLSTRDALAALASLQRANPRWCVAVLEAMPDEGARELLRGGTVDFGMPLSSRLRKMAREGPNDAHGLAHPAVPVRQSSQSPDLDRLAEEVDKLDARGGAKILKELEPDVAARVLDLLGTRKAKVIQQFL
jgi:hypothetical protein